MLSKEGARACSPVLGRHKSRGDKNNVVYVAAACCFQSVTHSLHNTLISLAKYSFDGPLSSVWCYILRVNQNPDIHLLIH